ncbi:MAG TPA: methyltransferase [Candidatus Limnocylindria bacterium]|nr:methyltransferase [Candidatus Limnocylindria bacterium]
MAEQYFEHDPRSESRPRPIEVEYGGERFGFVTDAGVFSGGGLDDGTRLLLDAALPLLHGRVLDLGCGWGPVGVIAGKLCPACSITMLDVNARACALAEANAKSMGVRAEVVCADSPLAAPGPFDWILLNPPIRAGKQAVYALFRESRDSLAPGGKLAVVIRRQQGAESARDYLGTLFAQVTPAKRKKGYHVYICEGDSGDIR